MLSVHGLQAGHGTGPRRRTVVHDVSFDVPTGAIFTLLGPSGCGKTTLLRVIAGLSRPESGRIVAAGITLFSAADGIDVPANRRGFGMVFQSYAIWPHLTVFKNVAFPLEVAVPRLSRSQIADRVERCLDAVGLLHLAGRPAPMLSGGQQQRLALARALVGEPKLLLLDEPLSNLDARLRERMRVEIQRLQRETGVTTLYVTHDQDEALALSHEIAVMQDGRIVQRAAPRALYEMPASRFVAGFVGSTNLVDGRVGADPAAHGPQRIEAAIGAILANPHPRRAAGEPVTVAIRPEDVVVVDQRVSAHEVGTQGLSAGGRNLFQGIVRNRIFLGPVQDLQVDVRGELLHARTHPSVNPDSGDTVTLAIDPARCLVLDRQVARAA